MNMETVIFFVISREISKVARFYSPERSTLHFVGLGALTPVIMKNFVFSDITAYITKQK
jgi:hypothetical protein